MATTSVTSSSTSSATSTAADIAAANKAAAQKLITSLSAGSGVDVASLAQNLVDAEKAPRQNAINAKITKNESRISGYSAVSFALSQIKTALADLKDQKDFNTLAANSSSSSFTATASTIASKGNHDIDVLSLAKAQRTVSGSFSSPTTPLNGGNAMSFSLTVGSGSSAKTSYVSVPAGSDTPRGLVDTINAANAGVTASLVNTGDATNPYKIVISGQTGASNSFSLTPANVLGNFSAAHDGHVNSGSNVSFQITPADTGIPTTLTSADTPDAIVTAINSAVDGNGNSLGLTAKLVTGTTAAGVATSRILVSGPAGGYTIDFSTDGSTFNTAVSDTGGNSAISSSLGLSNNQSASDAIIKVDGVSYTRTSNTFSDVLTGVTFNLKAVTTTGATDGNGNLVSNTGLLSVTRDTSSIETKLNALVAAYNDAATIFAEVTDPKSKLETYGATLVGDASVRLIKNQVRDMLSKPSSTPGANMTSMWQVGISIDSAGSMSLDSEKLASALDGNYDDVVKIFTGNQNDLGTSSTTAGGVAGDAYKTISAMLSSTGVIATQSSNAETQITKYQTQLTKLDTRMEALLIRYQTQFAAMNSLVGNVNSQKTSLKSTFDGMMSMYTNK